MKHESTLAAGPRAFLGRSGAVLSLVAGLLAAGGYSAMAHPGHGLIDAGAAHVLGSPYHLFVVAGPVLGLALALAWGARFAQSRWARRTLQCGSGLALLAAAAIWMS